MSNSLKEILYYKIKCRYPFNVPIDEVEMVCKANNYKLSNAERRLREMHQSGLIDMVYDEKKKYIKAYKFIVQDKYQKKIEEQFAQPMF